MRAVVVAGFGGPEVLRVAERPRPAPEPGEVVIRVQHAGVGFVDALLRSGAFDFLPTPFTPGIEVAGEISELGAGVTGLDVGQRVVALLNDFLRGGAAGGYAEFVAARADLVVPLPDALPTSEAAAVVANGATAWIALTDQARVRRDDTLLVLGATGGVGGMAARIAAAAGVARIIGVTGSAERADLAREYGCTDVVVSPDRDELHTIAPDVVFDPVGGALRANAFAALAPLGRHLVVGNAAASDASVHPDSLWRESRTIAGLSLGGIAHLHPGRIRAALVQVLELLERGDLVGPSPVVLPLPVASEAHRQLEARAARGKLVLEV